ncbi:MAG TPA: riboflavin synthase, partial [Alphaproteobacteria bacterium]
MFTGIIKDMGEVIAVSGGEQGRRLKIRTGFAVQDIAIGASVACDGCCLTVVEKGADWLAFDVSGETLSKTNV